MKSEKSLKTELSAYDRRELRLELARISFWDFCRVMAPEFYANKPHLRELCERLQAWYESNIRLMVINLPPRFGKSRTASLFSLWAYGQNAAHKIMIGSYNEILSQTFSKSVRDNILTDPFDPDVIVYRDIFPWIQIQRGDGAVNKWSLEGQYSSYLATSPSGTATGFGADLFIIDDLVKNALEANNANVLEGHWSWYTDTMISRMESGCKLLVIMTRWHSKDFAGRIMAHYNELGIPFEHINMKAKQDDGTMLCPGILSEEEYVEKCRTMGLDIASANYQQEPIDIRGKLYSSFKTYDKLPVDDRGFSLIEEVCSYCDTADEGSDYLCHIVYGRYNHEAYIIDVYYTKEGMEVTEPETARRLTQFKVARADFESNNGGRGFARSVDKHLYDLKNYFTVVRWFHQSKNKVARILTNATWVMEHMYFPVNWNHKWPEYYEAMSSYQREGKNAHDDGPDATTGVAENCNKINPGVI